MDNNELFRHFQISASGLHAERTRMQVIAKNIANAQVTRMADGSGPYRRKEVVFAHVMGRALGLEGRADVPGGVRVEGVVEADDEGPLVYRPGHPDADENGNVRMPNVDVSGQMVDLLMASRAYEANLNSIRAFQEMMRQTLGIGRQ